MAEHPLEQASAHRLPYIDPSTLEDRTRPPRIVPMLFGRPIAPRSGRRAQRVSSRAKDLLRSLARATTRN